MLLFLARMGPSVPHTHAHTLLGTVPICRDRDYKIWKRNEKDAKREKRDSTKYSEYGIPGRWQLWLDP